MARPRTNDPAGTSDDPQCTSDPTRLKELMTEFNRRRDFVLRNYLRAKNELGSSPDFNRSQERLKASVTRPAQPGRSMTRLHPEMEMLISDQDRHRQAA